MKSNEEFIAGIYEKAAVYTEEKYRAKGIAGKLLNIVVEDMKEKGIITCNEGGWLYCK